MENFSFISGAFCSGDWFLKKTLNPKVTLSQKKTLMVVSNELKFISILKKTPPSKFGFKAIVARLNNELKFISRFKDFFF